jgi:hypothetical protein
VKRAGQRSGAIAFPLTVTRFHSGRHEQLRRHLADVMAASTFARRPKTLGGLPPHEHIRKIWTSGPDRPIPDPVRQMPGVNIWVEKALAADQPQFRHYVGGQDVDLLGRGAQGV